MPMQRRVDAMTAPPPTRGHDRREARRAAAGLLVLVSSWVAAADPLIDVIDQENAPATAARSRCDGGDRSLWQAFCPRATPLSAVALDVRDVPAAGESALVQLRAGAPDGPVLGGARAVIAADGWVRFVFAAALPIELDGYYVIEWVRPRGWWAQRNDDPYARGEAYDCAGEVLAFTDFNFRTYAPAAHWQATTWSAIKRRLGRHERGSTSIRVDGGKAR
jgi:hypothetical protein